MRLIMLDTETTGLSPQTGDRMVEIGAVEVCQRAIQEDTKFHRLIHPQRPIPETVVRIHGIDDAKVRDKPTFPEIADEFLAFIEGAILVIHNAPFDLGFLMHELSLAGISNIGNIPVIDSLAVARKRHPHQRNSLNALCDRYGVDRGHRVLHGALLDAELLAEMYLAMTGGNQFSLSMDTIAQPASQFVQISETQRMQDEMQETRNVLQRKALTVPEADEEAHQKMMQHINKACGDSAIWQPSAH